MEGEGEAGEVCCSRCVRWEIPQAPVHLLSPSLHTGREGRHQCRWGQGRILTSRTEPAGKGHRRASASGTWASRRRPGRRACSSRPLCSAASRAGRQDAEGVTPQPQSLSLTVPEVGAWPLLPSREGCRVGTVWGPGLGGGTKPLDDNCISLIISMQPGHESLGTCPAAPVSELTIWGQKITQSTGLISSLVFPRRKSEGPGAGWHHPPQQSGPAKGLHC